MPLCYHHFGKRSFGTLVLSSSARRDESNPRAGNRGDGSWSGYALTTRPRCSAVSATKVTVDWREAEMLVSQASLAPQPDDAQASKSADARALNPT